MSTVSSVKQLFKENQEQGQIPFCKLLEIFRDHLGIKGLPHLTEVLNIITDSKDAFITERVLEQLVYTYVNGEDTLARLAFYASDAEHKEYLTKFEFEELCMNLKIGLSEVASKELQRCYADNGRFNCEQWCQCYNNLCRLIRG